MTLPQPDLLRPPHHAGSGPAAAAAHHVPDASATTTGAKPDYSEQKIVVAMVGLPARGKSYLSNKLMRYLKVGRRALGWRKYLLTDGTFCCTYSGSNTTYESSTLGKCAGQWLGQSSKSPA